MAYDYANLKRFEKSQINGLTKHLAGLRFSQHSEDNHTRWERIFRRAEELGLEIGYSDTHGERLDFKVPRKITSAQAKFGKKNGETRSGKRVEFVGIRVLEIAKKVSRFEFVGVQVLASQGWYPCQVIPIYRAYDRKGNYFDYAPVHWGEPLIMESTNRRGLSGI